MMGKKVKAPFKKGQHLIIRMRGDNGDLIVGRVDSVRTNGYTIGQNLLTGNDFKKKTHVLVARNEIVSKSIAKQVVMKYLDAGARGASDKAARQAARELAVQLVETANAHLWPMPQDHAPLEESPQPEDSPATLLRMLIECVRDLKKAIEENTLTRKPRGAANGLASKGADHG